MNNRVVEDGKVQQKPALWTKQFVTLTLASFLLFLNLQMLLSSFSMHIKSNLYGGDMQVSFATSVFAITAIVARLLTARWMKRWSRDRVLTVGLIVAAAATALSAVPDTVGPLLLMRAIYGLGFGIGSTIIPTLVSQIIPPKRMGEGIGYFGLSTSLAMSIGPAAGMSIMKEAGFTTLAILGAGAVLCMFPMLLISGAYRWGGAGKGAAGKKDRKTAPPAAVTEGERERKASADASVADSAAAFVAESKGEETDKKLISVASNTAVDAIDSNKQAAMQKGKLWTFPIYFPALMNVLISITYSGILSFIAVYGEELKLANVGLFFLFNALTILLIRPIAGKIFDSKGPIIVLIPAALFVIVSMLVLSYTSNMGMLITSAMLYGVGFGSIQPTLQAWMLRSADKEQYGAVNGMFYNATDVGVSVGALLLGMIVTLTSYDVMYRLSSVCMVVFVVAIVWYALKRGRGSQHHAADTGASSSIS